MVEPSGAPARTTMVPRSSVGASSDSMILSKKTFAPATASPMTMTVKRHFSATERIFWYPEESAFRNFSMALYNAPCFSVPCFRRREHIIGVSVSATKPEIITAPASVSANSTKSLPVFPGEKAMGV